jgi:hypothetical protein
MANRSHSSNAPSYLRAPPALSNNIRIIGTTPDGLAIIIDGAGRKRHTTITYCAECEQGFPELLVRFGHSDKRSASLCFECNRRIEWDELEEAQAKSRASGLNRRLAAITAASPAWRDRDKIRAIYQEARDLTQLTGVLHEVDHFYPLQGQLCCGLHIPENLRVTTFSENRSKKNTQPLEESPATVAFINQYGFAGLKKWLAWAKAGIT